MRSPLRSLRLAGVAGWLLLGPAVVAQAQVEDAGPPAIVALVLDTSGSLSHDLLMQARDLASGVLESLPPSSQVAVFTFDDRARLVLERSSNAAAVQAAIFSVAQAGRYTALYDALYEASVYLRDAPPSRKAIVLLTDGKDENSSLELEDGLGIASADHIPVFTVGMGKRVEEVTLRRISKLTGGRYASIGSASGFEIAAHVQELSLERPAPPAASVAEGGPAPGGTVAVSRPEAAPVGWRRWLLFGVLGVGLGICIAAAVSVLWLRRRRPAAASKEPHTTDEADEAATVLLPAPEQAEVAKTVLMPVRPSLKVVEGPRLGEVHELSPVSASSLGRSPTNDVVLDDVGISGEHCRIRPEKGGFVVLDLGSTNGTFVNDRRVERHVLESGDVIRIGESRFVFRLG